MVEKNGQGINPWPKTGLQTYDDPTTDDLETVSLVLLFVSCACLVLVDFFVCCLCLLLCWLDFCLTSMDRGDPDANPSAFNAPKL